MIGLNSFDRLQCCSQAQAGSHREAAHSQNIGPHADSPAASIRPDGVVDLTKDLPEDVAEDDVPLSQRLSSRKLSRKSKSQLPSGQPEPGRPNASGLPSDPRLTAPSNPVLVASAPGKCLVSALLASPDSFVSQPVVPGWRASCIVQRGTMHIP